MEEAAGKNEANPVPGRAEEKAVADKAPYLTNTATAAAKTIAAIGASITRD